MSDASPILGLPYIQPAQAQKHVTHNEALRLLDALVQLAVADRTRSSPPTEPAPGDRHIVGPGATGAWAGREGQIAVWEETGWAFLEPREGWVARILAEGQPAVWHEGAWVAASEEAVRFARLGVNATADSTNQLTVSAPATLLNHAGAGHQLKLNKAAAGETASLLFQTGFSGRAEMGTAGSDDFAVKVSADGADWTEALVVEAATGRLGAPQGLALGGGSAAAPALGFAADADTGLFSAGADMLGIAAGGAQQMRVTGGTVVIGPGGVDPAFVGGPGQLQISSGTTFATLARYSNDINGPLLRMAKSRSTSVGTVTTAAQHDRLGRLGFFAASDTGSFVIAAEVSAAVDGTISGGDAPGRLMFFTTPPGGSAVVERMRVTSAGNVGIATTAPTAPLHVNGALRVGSFTVATLPSASALGAGAIIHVSNESGGAVPAFSDGTAWRRVTDRAVVS